ncbi:DUF927 domain-containing protein [Shewanella frigidimarina]|uniref:DUF927 domain-containing protein n=1 Tax=Shewanella frigidimarina TaxID=56812 RepID=UPI003D799A78
MNTATTETTTYSDLVSPRLPESVGSIRLLQIKTNKTDVTAQSVMLDAQLKSHMVEVGCMNDGAEVTINDSGFWRFEDAEDAPGKKTGWCIPFYSDDNRLIFAMFGTHREQDENHFWEYSGFCALTDDEQSELRIQIENRKADLALERKLNLASSREELSAIIAQCPPVANHEYLDKKGVKAHGLLQGRNNELYIPFHDIDGNFITVQRILPDGSKFLWSGCGKTGGFLKIVGDTRVILIAEGYATAASLFEATGYTSIMAIDAGNLAPVAKAIQQKYPRSAIVLCCDNDQFKNRNTGAEKGIQIQSSLGIPYVLPKFEDLSSKPTDFNDLAQLEGIEAVVQQIEPFVQMANLRIPAGFELKESGVFHEQTSRDGVTSQNWLCSPLKITALTRDISSESWGRLLELTDNDGTEHRFALPMSMLTGQPSEYLKPLVNKGLTYSNEQRNHLHQYLSGANPINMARCVDKTGWFKRIFVLPNEVIGETDETIIFQSNSTTPKGFEASGTLDDWKEHVSSLCIDNSRLLFGTSVAFATILLQMLDGESGGFHFRCGSSRGKTTILMLAKSVWGTPDSLPRWRATANGLEGLATVHNHSLLCLDEFSQLAEVSPKVAGEAIYMLGNGEGKQRSRRDGSNANRQTWQLLYLSAGEVSLKATLEQAGMTVRAGQEVRFIDLPADAGGGLGAFDTVHDYADGNRFALAIKENAMKYHGTAAKEFIRQLSIGFDEYKEKLIQKVDDFHASLDLDGADPQVLRVAQRFATVAAAGELASEMGITGWGTGQADWASTVCFEAWLEERGGSESHEESQALDTVKGRLLEHGSARFVHHDGRPHSGDTWGHNTSEGIFVYTKAFSEHLCAGLDPKYVANLLNEQGYLSTNGARLTKTKRLDGKAVRCYHILPTLFSEADLETAEALEETDITTTTNEYSV